MTTAAALQGLDEKTLQRLYAASRVRLTRYVRETPSPKQAAFLVLSDREAFYGGAGGGGKSSALLMGALQYADVPGYSALIVRRTFAQLSKAGGLLPRSHEWLTPFKAEGVDYNGETHTWHFPSGATLEFGHIQHPNDKYNYQSAEYHYIAFDELTDFEEEVYRFLFSRLRRRTDSLVPTRMRAASNPGGRGHEWVKARFVDPGDPARPFLPARIRDNPGVDQEDYESSLAELPAVVRRQIMEGDWSARATGSYFDRSWFQLVDVMPAQARRVRYWDLAASEPREGQDPDWTVGARVSRDPDGVFYIEDVVRARLRPGPRDALIRQTAELDGPSVPIWIEEEPGASGKSVTDHFVRRLLIGFEVRGHRVTGPKAARAGPLSSQAEAGNVRLVRGQWNAEFLEELEAFTGDASDSSHDDQVDAASGAFSHVSQARAYGDYGITI